MEETKAVFILLFLDHLTYRRLENYEASIADYTEVMRISEANKKLAGNYQGIYLYALMKRAEVYALHKKNALAFTDYAKVLSFPPTEQSNYPLQSARVNRGKYISTPEKRMKRLPISTLFSRKHRNTGKFYIIAGWHI